MKLGKCISLFFVFSIISFCFGMMLGFRMEDYFYPDMQTEKMSITSQEEEPDKSEAIIIQDVPVVEASAKEDKLNADTLYIIMERNMDTDEIVETSLSIPEKYLGMTREQFLENLEDYVANPPLTELERGFVSAELLSFSTKQVEVQMNYQYIKPSSSFYIVVYNHHVVVMLDDKKTIYQDTEIELKDLPESIQLSILQGLFIPNEESLYDFLENYTS